MHTHTGHPHRWRALAVMIVCLLLVSLDTTILNVALPTLAQDLDATTRDLQWIVNAYTLVMSALLIPAGCFGDRFGRKKVLFLGLILFAIASVIAACTSSVSVLIMSRGLMGIGGAIIMPLTMSLLPVLFPPQEWTKAMAIWSASSGLGLLAGPMTGGWLLEHFHWGSIFIMNIPLTVVALIAGSFFIPESKNPEVQKIDWLGLVLSAVGFTLLIYGIIEGPEKGWTTSVVLYSLAGGILLLVAFMIWERWVKEPLIDFRLFRDPGFTWGTFVIVIMFFAFTGALFLITQYLQFALGYTPYETGIRLMPCIGALAGAALLSNRIVTRWGIKWIVTGGLLLITLSLSMLSSTNENDTYSFVAIVFSILGTGIGMSMAPTMHRVMEALPVGQVGTGSAINNTLRQVASTLGVALMGSIATSIYKEEMTETAEAFPFQLTETLQSSLGAALKISEKLPTPMKDPLKETAISAFVKGMDASLLISACILLVGTLLFILFFPSQRKMSEEVPHHRHL